MPVLTSRSPILEHVPARPDPPRTLNGPPTDPSLDLFASASARDIPPKLHPDDHLPHLEPSSADQSPIIACLGPSWPGLGPTWAHLGRSWPALGLSWDQRGLSHETRTLQKPQFSRSFWPFLRLAPYGFILPIFTSRSPILERMRAHDDRSWAPLGPSWAHLGPLLGLSWAYLGPSRAYLGALSVHLGPSWAHLQAMLTHLCLIWKGSWAILGHLRATLRFHEPFWTHRGPFRNQFESISRLKAGFTSESCSSISKLMLDHPLSPFPLRTAILKRDVGGASPQASSIIIKIFL